MKQYTKTKFNIFTNNISVKNIRMKYALYIVLGIFLASCSTTSPIYYGKNRRIVKSIEQNPILQDHFTGFVLYDIANQKKKIDINGDKYFTPASNTKIFTFYTALNILGDSIPVLIYQVSDSLLVFQGTGNPLFLNPKYSDTTAFSILKDASKKLIYNSNNNFNKKYGSGWAWDDAPYSYQSEITPFPIYGNLDSTNHPIAFSDSSFVKILSDTLHQIVEIGNRLPYMPFHTINIPTPDSLYILLLHESDNHVAEQLLAMMGQKQFAEQKNKEVIQYAKENFFNDLQNPPRWVDGSGLSRYNLFTPNSIISTLHKIYNKIGWEAIQIYFPAGGDSGTLKNFFQSENGPYVYAKTGTLSNNHNLSGFIITKKGNILIFSFMHNHYIYGSKKVKIEMEKILKSIWERY